MKHSQFLRDLVQHAAYETRRLKLQGRNSTFLVLTESQNGSAGSGPQWITWSQLQQNHPEHMAQDCVQMVLGCLQWGTLLILSGQSVQMHRKVLSHVQVQLPVHPFLLIASCSVVWCHQKSLVHPLDPLPLDIYPNEWGPLSIASLKSSSEVAFSNFCDFSRNTPWVWFRKTKILNIKRSKVFLLQLWKVWLYSQFE